MIKKLLLAGLLLTQIAPGNVEAMRRSVISEPVRPFWRHEGGDIPAPRTYDAEDIFLSITPYDDHRIALNKAKIISFALSDNPIDYLKTIIEIDGIEGLCVHGEFKSNFLRTTLLKKDLETMQYLLQFSDYMRRIVMFENRQHLDGIESFLTTNIFHFLRKYIGTDKEDDAFSYAKALIVDYEALIDPETWQTICDEWAGVPAIEAWYDRILESFPEDD